MDEATDKVLVILELSQGEAEALHQAVDRYFYARVFNELAQEMHEKVADALVVGGYDPCQARSEVT